MSVNLRNRALVGVQDYSPREFRHLLDLARDLKAAKRARSERQHLTNKKICLIADTTSTRTRCSFEVACLDQGAHVTHLNPAASQIGVNESFRDTARVLGRMYDAIEYHGASDEGAAELARWSGVPVFRGLSAEYHPSQMVADVMTMREQSEKPIHQIKYAFLGDARSRTGHALMVVGCLLGMDVRLCGPKPLWPTEEYFGIARRLQEHSGATLTITADPREAVAGADFIHTDVWAGPGHSMDAWKERIDLLLRYQVNGDLMKASRNPQVKFMHGLPAYHDTDTAIAQQIAGAYGLKSGLEVTGEVFESHYNMAFEQAENRMHTIKAMLVATLGN